MPTTLLSSSARIRLAELRDEEGQLQGYIASLETRIGREERHALVIEVDPTTGRRTSTPQSVTYHPADSLRAIARGTDDARAWATSQGYSSGAFAVLQSRAAQDLRRAEAALSTCRSHLNGCGIAIRRLEAGLPEQTHRVTERITKVGNTATLEIQDGRPVHQAAVA